MMSAGTRGMVYASLTLRGSKVGQRKRRKRGGCQAMASGHDVAPLRPPMMVPRLFEISKNAIVERLDCTAQPPESWMGRPNRSTRQASG